MIAEKERDADAEESRIIIMRRGAYLSEPDPEAGPNPSPSPSLRQSYHIWYVTTFITT